MTIDLHLLFSVCGYLGGVLLLASFAATSIGRLSSTSRRYHAANFVGGAALMISCFAQAAWPAVGVNVVWMAISVLTVAHAALVRARPPVVAPEPAPEPAATTERVLQPVT